MAVSWYGFSSGAVEHQVDLTYFRLHVTQTRNKWWRYNCQAEDMKWSAKHYLMRVLCTCRSGSPSFQSRNPIYLNILSSKAKRHRKMTQYMGYGTRYAGSYTLPICWKVASSRDKHENGKQTELFSFFMVQKRRWWQSHPLNVLRVFKGDETRREKVEIYDVHTHTQG